ncbi:MAG: RNA polymerase sigma factor [Planctomycetota bacterium]
MATPDPLDPGVRWMLAYQAGEEAAFDRIVERYSGQVWSLLTRFLGTHANREDLVQEVFLRVIRARASYRPTARLSTWLYRIAFNLAANERERAGVRKERSLTGPGDDPARELADEHALQPSDGLERGDVVAAVQAAIAALPEKQRMALLLARYEELPYAEIGIVLGSSEKAIKSLLHRARETLRVELAPFLSEEVA